MTDQEIRKVAYEPILESWKIIKMTQNLKSDDTEQWHKFVQAHENFCKKYDYGVKGSYGYYLGMAIMAVVDDIAKENMNEDSYIGGDVHSSSNTDIS